MNILLIIAIVSLLLSSLMLRFAGYKGFSFALLILSLALLLLGIEDMIYSFNTLSNAISSLSS